MATEHNTSPQALAADRGVITNVAGRVRMAALALSQRIVAARINGFVVEVARSTARYGADASVVKVLKQRLDSNQALRVQIQTERQRASVEPLQPKSAVMILYGLVFAEGIGVARVTVSAVDSEGKSLAFGCTDERGYFSLEVTDERDNQEPPLQVFLLVSDKGKALLFQGNEALAFKSGNVVYREIVIGDFRREPCPEPPKVEIFVVPKLDGLEQSAAEAALKHARLSLGNIKRQHSPNRIDQVIDQTPKAGARALTGTKVDLVIGIARKTTVPDVWGLNLQQAKEAIEKRKLFMGSVTPRAATSVDIVLEQNPSKGTEVEIETTVDLVVGAKGPKPKEDILDWFIRLVRG